MPANSSFDERVSTSLKNYGDKRLTDNIYSPTPLLNRLNARKITESGGTSIVRVINDSENATAKTYEGYEELDVTEQKTTSAAEFNWRQAAASISISGADELINQEGEQRLLNLIGEKITNAESAMRKLLTTNFYADGTGNFGKDWLGLDAICASSPSTGILGGIDRSVSTFWQNKALVGTKTTTAFDNIISKMGNMYLSCSEGSYSPDVIMADQASYEGYEGSLVDNKRFQSDKMADAGFMSLKFKGADVIFDTFVPATATLGNMFFLNLDSIRLVMMKGADMKIGEFLKVINQDAKSAKILAMGNLTVKESRRNGRLHGISLT